MSAVRAVLFDLDDTLYPEKAYAFSGFKAVATALEDRLGDPAKTTREMQRLFQSDCRAHVFDVLVAQRGPADREPLISTMIDIYRTHAPTITLYGDADAALSRLRGCCRLGLISDGRPGAQWAKIDALTLRDRLDEIILTAELGPGFSKPHPAAFELAARRLGVEPKHCAYVADNAAKDFLAPNRLGWSTVQIVRPDGLYREEPPPPGGQARYRLHTLDRLESAFEERDFGFA